MKSINMKLSLLMLLFGALIFMQCDRDRGIQQQSLQQIDETNRGYAAEQGADDKRHDEGRGDGASAGTGAGHVVEITDKREDLIVNMQELLSELIDELEQSAGTTADTEHFEEAQSDHLELTQLINDAEEANNQNWEDIREDVQETYVKIAVDHNERIRPEGAHGGRGF